MLARIKLKIGENEIEVDSRDFYVDNQTLGEIIENISNYLPENKPNITYEIENPDNSEHQSQFGLESLADAETYEPEFSEPQYVGFHEIKSKLRILETGKFFDLPRTVTETVQQLREYGWATSSLDVSKALAKMASNKEIMKDSTENQVHYFVQEQLLTS